MNKKILFSAAALLSALLLTACTAPSEVSSTASPTPTATATATPLADADTQLKMGVVTEASMGSLSITASDGTVYQFTVTDDTAIDSDSHELGNTVEVSFEGEYKAGINAEAIMVTQIVKKPTAEATPQTTPATENEVIRYITGTVTEATMNAIVIKMDDGEVIHIQKTDDTMVTGTILVDSYVQVFHKGNYKDGMVATEITELKAPETSAAETAQTSISGTISEEITMNTVAIETDDGKSYVFTRDDNTIVHGENLAIGQIVVVTYQGDLENSPVAVKVVVQ